MKIWKKFTAILLSCTVAMSLAACGSKTSGSSTTGGDSSSVGTGESAAATGTEGVSAGSGETSSGSYKDTLNVAYNAQPATFDPHVTGATATREVDRNVLEGLFEEDADGNPQPQLGES